MKKENWGCLHHGIVVFLDLPVEVIYDRLTVSSKDPNQLAKRPLLLTPGYYCYYYYITDCNIIPI